MAKHKNEQGTDAAANPHHQGWNKLTRDCIEKTTASADSTDPALVEVGLNSLWPLNPTANLSVSLHHLKHTTIEYPIM